MLSKDTSKKKVLLGLSSAMAALALAGCAANSAPRADVSAAGAHHALAQGQHHEAVQHAEAAVLADPRNAAYRVTLGDAYLEAGRFASAETAFDEAMTLGENSPRVALSLALALSGQAKYSESAALLSAWEGMIAPADIGLALALAGRAERGIHIMSNAIRAGENTAKMRQNLAYAYAVAGQWREARLMAQQDIPADQVGERMAEWASMTSAQAYQYRVANLLNVPAGVSDPGRPVHLALANNPSLEQLADEAAMGAELAALDAAAPVLGTAAAAPLSDVAVVAEPGRAPGFADSFAEIARSPVPASDAAQIAPSVVPAASPARPATTARYASLPAAQPARAVAQPAAAAPARRTASSPSASSSTNSTHLVQLGSFSSERGALRAWDIYVARYPELADQKMVITQAVVNGKRHWRVSAGDYNRLASRAMCSRVNSRSSDGCITWAYARPLPGAVDNGLRLARR